MAKTAVKESLTTYNEIFFPSVDTLDIEGSYYCMDNSCARSFVGHTFGSNEGESLSVYIEEGEIEAYVRKIYLAWKAVGPMVHQECLLNKDEPTEEPPDDLLPSQEREPHIKINFHVGSMDRVAIKASVVHIETIGQEGVKLSFTGTTYKIDLLFPLHGYRRVKTMLEASLKKVSRERVEKIRERLTDIPKDELDKLKDALVFDTYLANMLEGEA